ncbi:MAG TPA: hypothetical protein VFZ32_11025 [Micromonosporaceae bacterium]
MAKISGRPDGHPDSVRNPCDPLASVQAGGGGGSGPPVTASSLVFPLVGGLCAVLVGAVLRVTARRRRT